MLHDYEMYKSAQARIADSHRDAERQRLVRAAYRSRVTVSPARGFIRWTRLSSAALLRAAGETLFAVSELLGGTQRSPDGCSDASSPARSGC